MSVSSKKSVEMAEGSREAFSDYVAHLQLHMTLQARNLLPSLNQHGDRRQHLLHQSQAALEILASRQGF